MSFLGENIPKLGFGLMRLPKNGGVIDVEQVKTMVDMFLSAGFTYFDTAYVYQGSEAAIKLALVDRYPRDIYQLASKLPAWAGAKNADEARAMFYTSLERTGAGYFDFYLLHNLGGERIKYFDDYGIWDFANELKAKGLVRHVGFSLHDSAEVLDKILTAHPEMEFVQLQINYADWENGDVQSRLCYETARKHNKPVIIMEPVKGGLLAEPPRAIRELFRAINPGASAASWALRFAASLEGVITVLSGMSDAAQMKDNLETFKSFRPLDGKELDAIKKAQEILASARTVPCTDCRYCVKGCPENIAIPAIFDALNRFLAYENLPSSKGKYNRAVKDGGTAGMCIGCGQCESVCPQHIQIIDELKRAAEIFEKND